MFLLCSNLQVPIDVSCIRCQHLLKGCTDDVQYPLVCTNGIALYYSCISREARLSATSSMHEGAWQASHLIANILIHQALVWAVGTI
jgi:hypothetical protein